MGELCNHWTPKKKKKKRDGEWRETTTNTTDNTEHLSSTNLPGNGI